LDRNAKNRLRDIGKAREAGGRGRADEVPASVAG
jgi:hypothetical protein